VTRLLVLLALLWHVVVPVTHARATSHTHSLRAASHAHAVVFAAPVSSTTRESTRASESDDPPRALTATTVRVGPPSFVRLPTHLAAPRLELFPPSFTPTARGPPSAAV
jgi:hypothetical protein